jgi:hypothetical protein
VEKKSPWNTARLSILSVAERPISVLSDSRFKKVGEAAMTFHEQETRDALVSFKKLTLNSPEMGIDYSEEAIPERDPAYQLAYGTLSETQTLEHLPADRRLDLARCLEQLGMSPARAALMASL